MPPTMRDEARAIYSEASRASGENAEFTEAVAALAGDTASDYDDLASRLECEADIMRAAAKAARKLADREARGGHVTRDRGDCFKCGALAVAVGAFRTDAGTVRVCLSCQVLG